MNIFLRPKGFTFWPFLIYENEKDSARKEAMRYVLNNVKYTQKGETGIDQNYSPEIINIIDNKK